ncbi:MAG: hypothetical protein KDD62_14240, partial [Bdellovibrionales bacterium]|nr:hypothetical protein [Bdellovibrionales bacterium]
GSVNQTPLDWEGNEARLIALIETARSFGVQVLCLPELAITGYGCEDTFFSKSLVQYSLTVLEHLIAASKDIAVLVGLPIAYQDKRYNAAAFIFNQSLQGIVGKRVLCNDGVHYEGRWFSAWPKGTRTTIEVLGQQVPFGDIAFEVDGFRIGVEICEDAWVADRPAWDLAARDVDVILNASASHFAFGKYGVRKTLMLEAAQKSSCAYVYANLLGCEAGRMIYDGDCIISSGYEIIAEGTRFTFADQQLASACLNLEELRAKRNVKRQSDAHFIPVKVSDGFSLDSLQCVPIDGRAAWESLSGEALKCEEFLRAVALGLFDYLRKTYSGGFVVSLSGGSDSSSVVVLVHAMVRLAISSISFAGLKQKLAYIPGIQNADSEQALMKLLLTCVYQRTKNNSEQTQHAARELSKAVGAEYFLFELDKLVTQYVEMVEAALGSQLTWENDDVALQNVQARVRVPGLWLLANKKKKLLLTTSNRSEAAVGYTTMDG